MVRGTCLYTRFREPECLFEHKVKRIHYCSSQYLYLFSFYKFVVMLRILDALLGDIFLRYMIVTLDIVNSIPYKESSVDTRRCMNGCIYIYYYIKCKLKNTSTRNKGLIFSSGTFLLFFCSY